MKKLILPLFLLCLSPIFGEDTFSTETEHYRVVSHISKSNAELTGAQLESFYGIFNDVFRFDTLPDKMNVRVLDNESTFKTYTKTLTGTAYSRYVYIHQKRSNDSELLIFEGSEEDLIYVLAYQASNQFLLNHVPNAPLWIREGFSVYFSKSSGPELERSFSSLKNSDSRIAIKDLTEMSSDDAAAVFTDFRTEAWAFITFLMTTENKEHTRFLYDTIASLKSPSLGNASVSEDLQSSYNDYLNSFLNARELMEMGVKLYNGGEIDTAAQVFSQISGISPESWQPYYFLGLISYDKSEFEEADVWYGKAGDLGAPEALIAYVMGLTAWKDSRIDEAKGLLSKAARLDSEKYGEKTEPILNYLQGEYPDTVPVTIP